MIVRYNTTTGQVTGYVTVGSLGEAPGGEAFVSSTVTPDPISQYEVVAGVVRKKDQTVIDASIREQLFVALRAQRDALLTASDYTQRSDSTHPGTKAEWLTYMQALRDLPGNTTDPANPTWPDQPE